MERGAWWATVHGVQREGHNWSDLARTPRTQSNKTAVHFKPQWQAQVMAYAFDWLCIGDSSDSLQLRLPVASPGLILIDFWLTLYKSEVPTTSFLHSVSLLELLQNSRNPFTCSITDLLQRLLEDTDQQPDEELHRAMSPTKELLFLGALEPCLVASRSTPFPQPGSSLNLILWVFYDGFIVSAWLISTLTIGIWFNL